MRLTRRAVALCEELQRAVGSPVTVTAPTARRIRLTVTLPVDIDEEHWRTALRAVQGAPDWGSADAAGALVIWAELDAEGEGP
jgi:hypothetical protein